MANTALPPPTLNTSSDPCSFNYVRHLDASGLGSSGSDRSRGVSVKKPGFFARLLCKNKSAKKAAPKSANAGFVLPYERDQPQSSGHSHAVNNMAMAAEPTAAVALTITRPTVKGRNTAFRVHSYVGEDQPAAAHESVRFSHPAVNAVRPITPTPASASLLDVTDDGASMLSCTPPDPSPAALADGNVIRPKTIWRNSGHFETEDGELTSFAEFKARFDGHPFRTSSIDYSPVKQPVSDVPPSLNFIPSVGSFTIADEPVFRSDSATPEPLNVKKTRNNALNMLKSGGVLAVLPAADMPDSAVPVLPAALTPRQYPAALLPSQRPFSFPTTTAERATYQAYQPASSIANVISDKGKGKQIAPIDNGSRPKTPNFFGESSTHREHYTRVESGIFDPPAKPSAPVSTGAAKAIARKPVAKTYTTTPPPSRSSIDLRRHSKALPPATGSLRKASLVPEPHKMNENGYPVISASAAAAYTAEPRYQRRSINDVEAKFLRERAGSKAVKPTAAIATEAKEAETKARPVSSMMIDRMLLSGMEEEKKELERKIEAQAAKVARKAAAAARGRKL